MITALVLVGMLGLVGCMMSTKEDRAAARQKFARLNPLWIGLIIVQLAFIFWPRR